MPGEAQDTPHERFRFLQHDDTFELQAELPGPDGPGRSSWRSLYRFDLQPQHRIDAEVANKALAMLDVDPQGFDVMDRKLLEAVVHRFDGGPVGLDNIAASIGEERDTIEDVIEPYLIQQGYLQRTPRGRMATPVAYQHSGVTAPRTSPNGNLWDQS